MSLTRSLTLPLTRALSHTELTQKLGESFSPYSLNPYLLFDARDSMIGTLENPTLDLNPALPETLDVITATRAGVATYTDASGLIQAASPNTVRVDQTQGAELTPTKYQRVGYTDFSNPSQWSKSDATLTSGQLSPNGDNTATKLTATGNDPYIYKLINTSAQTHTFSFYCKGEGPTIGKTARLLFWYVGGATGTTESVNFTYSGEWQRFELQTTPTGAGTLVYRIDVPSDVGVVGESVYIWGPQLEEGTTASDFVANTTGSPKFITGATYGPRLPMILVEPSATNLVDDSTSFDTPGDITKTSGIDAPDGTNTATKISGILSSSSSDMAYSKALTVASSTQVTGSIHVRGIAGEVVVIRTKRHTGGGYIASAAQEVTLTGNWQRVEGLTMTLGADNTNCSISIRKEGGSTADSVDIWGGQIETGSVATSYIPTSGSTVTRAADDLVITGSDFTNFYNQSEGTFYVEYVMGTDTGQPFVIDVDNGDDNRIIIYNANGNNLVKFIKSLGTSTVSDTIDTRSPVGALSRVALSYATNNVQASQDGGNVVTDTSATIPTNINRLSIGSRYGQSSVYKLNGHIKRLLYWPLHSDSL